MLVLFFASQGNVSSLMEETLSCPFPCQSGCQICFCPLAFPIWSSFLSSFPFLDNECLLFQSWMPSGSCQMPAELESYVPPGCRSLFMVSSQHFYSKKDSDPKRDWWQAYFGLDSKILESWNPEVWTDFRGHPVQSLKPHATSAWVLLGVGRFTFFQGSIFCYLLVQSVQVLLCVHPNSASCPCPLLCFWGHTNPIGSLCFRTALQVLKVRALTPCRL